MTRQISFFDGKEDFKIRKPIRLIEFFAGYGSQSKALEELSKWGLKFQHWKICEWAVKSIQAYKDMHFENDNTDYSKDLSKEFIVNRLFKWGISANYNEPMTKEQIIRLGEKEQRKIYNNIKATHNLVNIQQVDGWKLDIVDTDKYDYFLTYSFPCQDLSKAGLGKGMEKGSGTRSGLLWEVERVLDELNEMGKDKLPKVLLMENVPDVIGTTAIKDFAKWLAKLESLGYKCYWNILNAKNLGIPQNRERCFMVSILGDCLYQFPPKIKLEKNVNDLLLNNVDNKLYLGKVAINGKINTKFQTSKLESVIPNELGIMPILCARDYKDPKCIIISKTDDDYVEIKGKKYPITKNNENFIEWEQKGFLDSDCRAWRADKISGTLTTNGKLKILKDFVIRKCCPHEYFRLMGIKDEDFEKVAKNQSNTSLYHLAGDSIVVAVLVAIFGQMLDNFDFNEYIKEFYKKIKGE